MTVSPLSVFSSNLSLFLQKNLSLYIQIPNTYLELGFEFEFGQQRILGLVFIAFQLQDGDFALKSVFSIKLSPFMEKLEQKWLMYLILITAKII